MVFKSQIPPTGVGDITKVPQKIPVPRSLVPETPQAAVSETKMMKKMKIAPTINHDNEVLDS